MEIETNFLIGFAFKEQLLHMHTFNGQCIIETQLTPLQLLSFAIAISFVYKIIRGL